MKFCANFDKNWFAGYQNQLQHLTSRTTSSKKRRKLKKCDYQKTSGDFLFNYLFIKKTY